MAYNLEASLALVALASAERQIRWAAAEVMSPSEATNQATREEWRALGFYYELKDEPPCWRFVGSSPGLLRFAELLDEYVSDPENALPSEHEHYGPYMYLKVQTAESPQIDRASIRGSVGDLARLRDLIRKGLRDLAPGRSLAIGPEYCATARFSLVFEVCPYDFDPAAADPQLGESAVG